MDPVYILLDSDDSASDEDLDQSYFFDDGDDDNTAEEVNFDEDDCAVYDPVDSEPISGLAEKNCTILTEEDIKRRQAVSVAEICSVLEVSNAAACLLLLRHKWNVSNVHEEWFADEEKVRSSVGILDRKVTIDEKQPGNMKLACGICFDEYLIGDLRCSDYCEHLFCVDCWTGYVSTAITDGPGCLTMRCPEPKCGAAVGLDMIDDKLALTEEQKAKYHRYLLRSYVENSPKIKWCPAPGCEFAVEYVLGSGNFDVVCGCSNAFCWNCAEEAHRPVDCDIVSKWVAKNSSEAENTTWILAYSKPCPKCKRPIEKNHGCMHMTCGAPCKFEFCWLCLLDWKVHGYGNMNSCNGYRESKGNQGTGGESDAEKQRKMARKCLERYAHYYERWASNHRSRVKAIGDLHKMQDVHLERISVLQRQPVTELKFIIDAWQQIAECRRVLKWTYASGYYLFENELAKKQFFEYLQGEAEAALERLHLCAEKELKCYINPEPESPDTADTPPPLEFNSFRSKLTGLTRVTKDYFENLVRALENGLSDVDPRPKSKKHNSSNNKAGTSKGAASYQAGWACENCTYWNEQTKTKTCGMCHKARSKKPRRVQ